MPMSYWLVRGTLEMFERAPPVAVLDHVSPDLAFETFRLPVGTLRVDEVDSCRARPNDHAEYGGPTNRIK